MAGGSFGGGTGSVKNPFLIEDIADFSAIRLKPNANYKMMSNINFGVVPFNRGKGWVPIDNFSGSLDGNGKLISNLFINRPAEDNVGLFAKITQVNANAVHIFDLAIEDAKVTGRTKVGVLCGSFDIAQTVGDAPTAHYFERLHIKGDVYGNDYVGGVIGSSTWSGTSLCPKYAKDLLIEVNLFPTEAGINFGALAGKVISNKAGDAAAQLLIEHVISVSSFSTTVKGIVTPSFSPASFCVLTPGWKEAKSCFFCKDTWGSNITAGTTGATNDELKRRSISDFDSQYTGEIPTWNYDESNRIPVLTSLIQDRCFVKTSKGFCVYEDGEWKSKFTRIPTAKEALEIGMKNINALPFVAWDALRKTESQVEIINFIGKTKEVVTSTAVNPMTLSADVSTGNKNYFRQKITFDDFGHSIVSIIKGVVA